MKIKNFFTAMFIFGLFLLVIFLGAFLGACSRGEKAHVYFGDDGYVQYNIIGNDSIGYIFYNTGNAAYYLSTVIVQERSWFNLPVTSFEEIKVNPGDTVLIKKPRQIAYRWKGIDECGHEIPFRNIEYVGYWKDGQFYRKE